MMENGVAVFSFLFVLFFLWLLVDWLFTPAACFFYSRFFFFEKHGEELRSLKTMNGGSVHRMLY